MLGSGSRDECQKCFFDKFYRVNKTGFTHNFHAFECMASKLKVGLSMSFFFGNVESLCKVWVVSDRVLVRC